MCFFKIQRIRIFTFLSIAELREDFSRCTQYFLMFLCWKKLQYWYYSTQMLFLSNELLTNYNCLCRKLKTVVLQARSETISTWELSADELHPPNVLPSVGIPTRFFLNMSKNYLIRNNQCEHLRENPHEDNLKRKINFIQILLDITWIFKYWTECLVPFWFSYENCNFHNFAKCYLCLAGGPKSLLACYARHLVCISQQLSCQKSDVGTSQNICSCMLTCGLQGWDIG